LNIELGRAAWKAFVTGTQTRVTTRGRVAGDLLSPLVRLLR
jgi:hypothetical protein